MKLDFAVVVPVFNPEPGLVKLVEGLLGNFVTVIVVDDGSVRDRERFAELPPSVVRLRHDVNRGKGAAMKTALGWVAKERPELAGVVFADGDGQHRVPDVTSVARECAAKDAVVFGERDFVRSGVPFRSWWGNRWTAAAVWLRWGYRLRDTQTGLRAVPRRLVRDFLRVPGERFEYEAGWFGFLKRRREAIVTCPVATVYVAGNRTSHFRPWRDTILTQRAIWHSP